MKKIIIVGLAIIFIVALITVIYLFWPLIKYYNSQESTELPGEPEPNFITNEEPEDIASGSLINSNTQNLLLIPKIGVKIPIVEGNDESTLNKGAWRLPETSFPDKGSNTAIAGHRWKYRPPSEKTFYLLDKLEAGDEIEVFYNDYRYFYQVLEAKVTEASDVSFLLSGKEQLVLQTCWPLGTNLKRFVVIAQPLKNVI